MGGALLALAAAALWGVGDFSGGMAVKRAGGTVGAAMRVLLISHSASFCILLTIVALRGEGMPHGALLAWGLCAGLCGGLSLAAFYVALARGAMGASAAVSGVLAAAIPAAVSAGIEGRPSLQHLFGFLVTGLAIWMIAAGNGAGEGAGEDSRTTLLAIAAGAGFGFYFVCLRFANGAGLFWPLANARMGSLTTCVVLLALLPRGAGGAQMTRGAVAWAFGIATFDTGGNLLYLAATRAGRLDVAAVLASLYPVSTILLAGILLKERFTLRQGVGMGIALAAIGLVAL